MNELIDVREIRAPGGPAKGTLDRPPAPDQSMLHERFRPLSTSPEETPDILRPFGATGRRVARVGQGTWTMESSPRAAIAALQLGISLGATHIDTAEIYADGAVERIVGQALRGRRESVFLASKVNPARASREEVQRACDESLQRLGTDYLDLYLLHWLSAEPIEETVAGFEALVSAGKILHWGVSNFDETKLEELIAVAGPGRIACNQMEHSLDRRSIEHALVPYCERHGIAVVGYSPFGAGRFEPRTAPGALLLTEVAATLHATPHQVALAFLLHRSRGFTIPRALKFEHVADNAAAARLELDSVTIERLDAAFPVEHPPSFALTRSKGEQAARPRA